MAGIVYPFFISPFLFFTSRQEPRFPGDDETSDEMPDQKERAFRTCKQMMTPSAGYSTPLGRAAGVISLVGSSRVDIFTARMAGKECWE